MGISYAKAWRLVKEMNDYFPQALVINKTGGRAGGGATVTAEGRKAAADFWKLLEDFTRWLKARKP